MARQISEVSPVDRLGALDGCSAGLERVQAHRSGTNSQKRWRRFVNWEPRSRTRIAAVRPSQPLPAIRAVPVSFCRASSSIQFIRQANSPNKLFLGNVDYEFPCQ
ncbi:unnamed protein product, partial [Nesidiocoris tenuis]